MNQARILVFPRLNGSAEARALAGSEVHARISERKRRLVRLYLTAMILISMMFTVYVWQSTKMVEIRLRNNELDKRIESLATGNAVLRAEISKLQSLTRVEKVAKEELGMIIPKKMCYIPMPPSFLKP